MTKISRPDSRVIQLVKHMGARPRPNQRHFMISGLKGAGVKDLTRYLMEQAVERPWDEDPF